MDLLTRYEAFAKAFNAPRKPPTPIEDRWALDVKLQSAQPVAARSARHEFRNGICITCETT